MKRNHLSLAVVVFVLLAAILLLTACNRNVSGDDATNYPEYTVADNDDLGCVELNRNGVTYRPYGSFTTDSAIDRFIGEQIGVWEGVPDRKIFGVNGYDSSERIVDRLEVTMGGNMIWKAVGVSEIPSELIEYNGYDY
jgi:hypothetical protein